MNYDFLAPFARIMLRYGGAALMSSGVAISPGTLTDPDLVQVLCIVIGALMSGASEAWYIIAKKRGWKT